MNRTIEAWQQVAETRFHGRVLDQAIEDMQELARQRDELLAVLEHIATAFEAKTISEQFLMDEARAVIQKVRGGE